MRKMSPKHVSRSGCQGRKLRVGENLLPPLIWRTLNCSGSSVVYFTTPYILSFAPRVILSSIRLATSCHLALLFPHFDCAINFPQHLPKSKRRLSFQYLRFRDFGIQSFVKMRIGIGRAMPTVSLTLRPRGESRLSCMHPVRPLSSTPQVREKPGGHYEHELEKRLLQFANHQDTLKTKGSDLSQLMIDMENVVKEPYRPQETPHHLHVYAHKHNTHITLTHPSRDPMLSLNCGSLGFRKGHRGGYDASHQLAAYMMGKIQEKGFLMDIKRLEVILRGYGPGREAFTKVLLGTEGRNIRNLVVRVTDGTRLKFGGARSRRVRRLG
jgi:small subunit ribosomal protein S11